MLWINTKLSRKRFLELSSILEPDRLPKTDKVAILSDAVRVVTQLRNEAQELKETNDELCARVKELKGSTVGIIGGMSVDATLNFMRELVELSSQDGPNSIPLVLCSDPLLNEELLSYERGCFVSSTTKAESLKLDSSSIVQSLWNKRVFLENSGARCIVMPCNVSHSWYEQVSKGCSVPFLHMAECVAKELKEAKLKPLEAGSPLRIGVLATNATLAAGFYKEKL